MEEEEHGGLENAGKWGWREKAEEKQGGGANVLAQRKASKRNRTRETERGERGVLWGSGTAEILRNETTSSVAMTTAST